MNEFYVGGVHSMAQLTGISGLRSVTAIPAIRKSADQRSISDAVVDAPMSEYAESLRRLRAMVDQSIGPKRQGAFIVLVTSAMPVEGKTVTSISLARRGWR